ncbi:hypothetical protein [Xylocopilactobacillus apis]|uniref:SCP domain-containing protein n=1 Tax=Xylocopilactobacillus apis TaxID=2932183 RepID=A0AAU9D4I9_9LACO|nr:hypothetical protein [Xylocopilactobacillus apis]BDR56335.1 hypothetical protein KIMC2_08970 [Xylocopilactobacillus apis]
MKAGRRFIGLFLGVFVFFSSYSLVGAFTEEQKTKISAFQNEYRNLDQTNYYYKNVYSKVPAFSSSSFTGINSDKYLKSYDQTYNFVRSLFGLAPIVQNKNDNSIAITGAYDMAAVPKNDGSNVQHGLQGLTKPPYLSNEVWKQGSDATREGNIANIVPTNFFNYSKQSVWDDIMGFVIDSNNYDVNSVGHRDWMLSQSMKSYGTGTIYTDPANKNTLITNGQDYYALGYQVFYWGGGYDGNYDKNLVEPLTYPATDLFPLELMNSTNPLKPVCWSIGFNQASVINKNNKPKITIKNLNNGKSITVNSNDIYYESQYGGYNTVYSFIPRGLNLSSDQKYEISFSNLNLKSSKNNSLINNYTYSVSFYNLKTNSQGSYDYSNAGRKVYVNYRPNYGVRIYQTPGGMPTDTFVFHGTSWTIIKQFTDNNGKIWSQLGQNQWILNDYLSGQNTGRTPIGTVKYIKGYGINLWRGYGNKKTFSGRRINDQTQWKVFKKAIVGNTYWFNLGSDLWVDGQYMTVDS